MSTIEGFHCVSIGCTTYLEKDPVSVLGGCGYQLLSHWSLALPQGDGMDPSKEGEEKEGEERF